eukprot:TRINITY_DN4926_c0_g3_i1.p1 TRINITY_DN4926_c0_g3~~TRINITY_DN4926_c0_g3_i1.p1  ORF type:complete len:241 (+),score=25.73 TRINITY_DN4926_c0_g3_i1:50-724(+)
MAGPAHKVDSVYDWRKRLSNGRPATLQHELYTHYVQTGSEFLGDPLEDRWDLMKLWIEGVAQCEDSWTDSKLLELGDRLWGRVKDAREPPSQHPSAPVRDARDSWGKGKGWWEEDPADRRGERGSAGRRRGEVRWADEWEDPSWESPRGRRRKGMSSWNRGDDAEYGPAGAAEEGQRWRDDGYAYDGPGEDGAHGDHTPSWDARGVGASATDGGRGRGRGLAHS